MAAEHERRHVLDGDAELPGDEGPEARGIEHAGQFGKLVLRID